MTEIINNRYIKIDDDTLVGYDYPNQKFFVTNKGTTTTRNTAEQIVAVLEALEITQIKINLEIINLTPEYLENTIKNTTEILGSAQYTLTDDGAYIKTIQFNDWIDYPLEIDCEKGNIFIRNTNILFSLSLNIDKKERVARFLSYYLDTLGLSITQEFMSDAYDLLANQYNKPYFYNTFVKNSETNVLTYNNIFKLGNYNDSSAITCTCTSNPNSEFTNNKKGDIVSIDNTNDIINLKESIEYEKFLAPGFKVSVQGATVVEEGTTYTADGTYTVNQLFYDSNNKVESIQVDEPIQSSYEYPYPSCYAQSLKCSIYSMERENNIIKVTKKDFPQDLIVGDIIHVKGATTGSGLNKVSLDGAYTVQNVSEQVKQIINNIISMKDNTIVINTSETQLKPGDTLQVQGTNSINDNYLYTIKSKTSNSQTTELIVEEDIPKFYGQTSAASYDVGFRDTSATHIIDLPQGFNSVVINPGDLIQISGIEEPTQGATDYRPNNKLYTVLSVVYNDKVSVSVDSTVIPTPENEVIVATVQITPSSSATATSSTILYYNIYTEEEIATDYIPGVGQNPIFYKEVFISNIVNISGSLVTLESAIPSDISFETAYIHNVLITQPEEIVVDSINGTTITASKTLSEGMPEYPTFNIQKPSDEVLFEITTIHSDLESVVPTGEFMLDTFSQCQSYVNSVKNLEQEITAKESNIPTLDSTVEATMYTELKENSILKTIEGTEITFKGLYSEVYPNQDTL